MFLVCALCTHVFKSQSYAYFKGRLTGYVVTGLLFAVNGKPYFEDQEPVQGFVMNFSSGEIIDVFKPVRKVFPFVNYVSVFLRIKLKCESWNSIYTSVIFFKFKGDVVVFWLGGWECCILCFIQKQCPCLFLAEFHRCKLTLYAVLRFLVDFCT